MKIAIDLDGVLADASKIWMRLLNERFNIKVDKSNVDQWDFWKKIGISKKSFEEVFDDAWKEWQAIDETEIGLKENIDEIKDFGKTDLVTARNKKTMDDVMQWLEMTKITFDEIVVVDENYLKGNLDYDVFVDDSPIQVMEIANLDKVALVYDQPWNSHIISRNNLIRIKNFTEVISYIKDSKFRKALKTSKTQVLVSWHDFKKTPNLTVLDKKFKSMKKISKNVKIVTMANSANDAARVLTLYNDTSIRLIAFSMGENAKFTRILCLYLGSPFTYVSLGRAIAPGQFTLDEIKSLSV